MLLSNLLKNLKRTKNKPFWRIWVKLKGAYFPPFLLKTFLVHFFTTFKIFEIGMKFCFVYLWIEKKLVLLILLLYKNFEDKGTWNGSKKFFYKHVLKLNLPPSTGKLYQVVKIVVPYCPTFSSLFPEVLWFQLECSVPMTDFFLISTRVKPVGTWQAEEFLTNSIFCILQLWTLITNF